MVREFATLSRKILCAAPFLWLVGVLALYFRARLYLGVWPTYANPDPKLLPFEFHHLALQYGLFLLPCATFVVLVLWLVGSRSRSVYFTEVPVLATGCIAVIGAFLLEARPLIWFLD